MPALLFPDNTVLINFAIINRMGLLEQLANKRGQWCATVASECAVSSKLQNLESLHEASRIFGEPLYPSIVEVQDTLLLRDELASPGDSKTQHLGEAETIAIVTRRNIAAFFATDDKGARRLAANHGIQTATTVDLLAVAVRAGLLSIDHHSEYLKTLRQHKRILAGEE